MTLSEECQQYHKSKERTKYLLSKHIDKLTTEEIREIVELSEGILKYEQENPEVLE